MNATPTKKILIILFIDLIAVKQIGKAIHLYEQLVAKGRQCAIWFYVHPRMDTFSWRLTPKPFLRSFACRHPLNSAICLKGGWKFYKFLINLIWLYGTAYNECMQSCGFHSLVYHFQVSWSPSIVKTASWSWLDIMDSSDQALRANW